MSPAEFMQFGTMVFMGIAFIIAVTGITVRFVGRPNARAGLRASSDLEQRVARIEGEMESLAELRTSMERLTEELEFERQLTLPAAGPASATVRSGA